VVFVGNRKRIIAHKVVTLQPYSRAGWEPLEGTSNRTRSHTRKVYSSQRQLYACRMTLLPPSPTSQVQSMPFKLIEVQAPSTESSGGPEAGMGPHREALKKTWLALLDKADDRAVSQLKVVAMLWPTIGQLEALFFTLENNVIQQEPPEVSEKMENLFGDIFSVREAARLVTDNSLEASLWTNIDFDDPSNKDLREFFIQRLQDPFRDTSDGESVDSIGGDSASELDWTECSFTLGHVPIAEADTNSNVQDAQTGSTQPEPSGLEMKGWLAGPNGDLLLRAWQRHVLDAPSLSSKASDPSKWSVLSAVKLISANAADIDFVHSLEHSTERYPESWHDHHESLLVDALSDQSIGGKLSVFTNQSSLVERIRPASLFRMNRHQMVNVMRNQDASGPCRCCTHSEMPSHAGPVAHC
jgi:hypothetical protein